MSDTTINQFVSRGTHAQRLAYTPNPPTAVVGPSSGYFWFETDTHSVFAWDGSTWQLIGGAGFITSTGVSGFAFDGDVGDDGFPIVGPRGAAGISGATGPSGQTGFGLDGEDGQDAFPIPGPQGLQGATGSIGPAGTPGTPGGPPGPPGFFGEDGEEGMIGPPGPAGASGVGGSGALTLLEQHTASTSASLDFTTAIVSTYDEYQIELVNVIPSTNAVSLWLRMSTDGGATYDSGANYSDAKFAFNNAASGTSGTASGGTKIDLMFANIDNTTAKGGVCGTLRLFNPLGTSSHKHVLGELMWVTDFPVKDSESVRGSYESTTAVNAIRFLASSGNLASGTIRMYGISK